MGGGEDLWHCVGQINVSLQGQEATLNPGPPGGGQCLSAPEPGPPAGKDKKVGSSPALGALVPGPAAPCTALGALNGKLPAWCSQYIYSSCLS